MSRHDPLEGALAALPDCVFRADLSLRLEAVSPAATGMFGIPAAALVGTRLGDLVSPDDLARLQDLLHRTLESTDRTASLGFQTRIRHADGHLVPVEVHSRLLLGEAGEPEGIVGVARDITGRQRELEAARRADREQARERKHGALARLATEVSADLAAALAALDDTGREEPRPEPSGLRQRLDRRLAELRRIAGELPCHRRERDLDATVAAALDELREQLPAGPAIVHQPGCPGAVAAVDAVLLRQALAELLANARAAAPHGGHLVVRTRVEDAASEGGRTPSAPPAPQVRIVVADGGEGLSAVAEERAGEPYFTTRPGAAGLGLTLVRAIAAVHGGRFELSSVAGRGAEASLVLPARFATAPEVADAAPAVEGRPTVLVVDDDGEVRRYVQRVLRAARMQVIPCADGVDALAHLAGDRPVDAVVLDWALPGLDGRRVREHVLRRQPRIPLLVISGHTREQVAALGGVDDRTPWLVKPFTPGELRAAVTALLAGKAAESGS